MTTVAGDRQARGDVHVPWDKAAWTRRIAGAPIAEIRKSCLCEASRLTRGTAAPALGLPTIASSGAVHAASHIPDVSRLLVLADSAQTLRAYDPTPTGG